MTESQGLLHDDVAVAVVVKVMEIGAAETGGLHGDLDFGCFWGAELAVFL